ncbi:unnamed protein product [Brachionus calyciflorus]|uniref:Uncharacterized protein n=1 Tax=Brachionus calyciflorus TaxID=104777 RepID=A0A814MX39_9BILA|nr:unnamed protein product [Brachionus calyciflorus]
MAAKIRFLKETLLPFPPKLENKIDLITDVFRDCDIDLVNDKILKKSSEKNKVDEDDPDLFKLGTVYNFEKYLSIDEVQHENVNPENPSSGYKWDSSLWKFDGFCNKNRKPNNLAHTVINITDFGFVEKNGTKDLYFRTFCKPHDLPGVPRGNYDPLWVYAGDMVPLKDSLNEDDPDCRELIEECLYKKKKEDRIKCETWLMENNFDFKCSDFNEDEKAENRNEQKRKPTKEKKEKKRLKK